MSYVHLFTGDDVTVDDLALKRYVLPTYTADGDKVPSRFMEEVSLTSYEPAAIEHHLVSLPIPLDELLSGHSYFPLWRNRIPPASARYCILVYEPNEIAHTRTSMVRHLGRFAFEIPRIRQPWDA